MTASVAGNNVLPVGHTFVKGVNLLDGHVVSFLDRPFEFQVVAPASRWLNLFEFGLLGRRTLGSGLDAQLLLDTHRQ